MVVYSHIISLKRSSVNSPAGSNPKDFVLSNSFKGEFLLSPRKDRGTTTKTRRLHSTYRWVPKKYVVQELFLAFKTIFLPGGGDGKTIFTYIFIKYLFHFALKFLIDFE